MNHHYLRFALIASFAAGLAAYAADAPPATQPSDATTQPTTNPSLNWDEAKNHIGETVTVTGPVMGTHAIDSQHALILNIGKDFPDEDRFTAFITGDGDTTPSDDTYNGKTVSVTGKIMLYRKVPEIKASEKDVVVK
jgi:DNA/RNA endonuclease YhcR with UshA esterase domain